MNRRDLNSGKPQRLHPTAKKQSVASEINNINSVFYNEPGDKNNGFMLFACVGENDFFAME